MIQPRYFNFFSVKSNLEGIRGGEREREYLQLWVAVAMICGLIFSFSAREATGLSQELGCFP